MKNLFGSALLTLVSKDRNVSSGLRRPVVCLWYPYTASNDAQQVEFGKHVVH